MNDASIEFNKQLELDVLLNGMTELAQDYVMKFDRKNLTEVIIPEGVTTIADWAFEECGGLTSITIPNSVKSIGKCAFTWCEGLTNVTIPDSVTSIDNYAFYKCSNLTHIMISDSVTDIGYGVFEGCNKLSSAAFKGKTFDEVRSMPGYPWGISRKTIVQVA